ncbi:MAG TPA: outer membrane protein [Xanthobacteraceae bacterium]|nr:outer membrane protein [Xanthobacteraceae bacterium]
MRSARVWVMVGTVMLAASAANAAEPPLYQPPPPPQLQPICVPRAQAHLWPGAPICAEEFSSWYLRGDIGMTNQKVRKLENKLLPASANIVNSEFDSSMLFGIGAGVHFNNWLRFDATGEYRGNSDFAGLDVIDFGGGGTITNEHRAKKSEWLFLANAYIDLGTWWCVTPFVGAGIGASRVTISSFTDICTTCGEFGSVAFGKTESKWNFAWALHAGLAFQATNNLAIELAYRYTNLGDGVAGDLITFTGTNDFKNPTTFKDITSHDLKLGLRWTCCDEPAPVAAPVMYQPPPPVYQPPPLYAPPVMRKG